MIKTMRGVMFVVFSCYTIFMFKFDVKTYVKELITIALPIIMGNLGFILIGVGDVLIAGRHSTDTLAAISIATAILNCIAIFGTGIMCGISPLLSNYRGENVDAKRFFFSSVRFSVFIALFVSFAMLAFIPVIDYLGFDENLIPMIKQYMLITVFSNFGACLHMAVKEYLQAFEIVFVPNLVTVVCVFLNVALNTIFVFGCGVIPSLGVVGLAIASLITRYIMGLSLYFYALFKMHPKDYHKTGFYKGLIKIGLPIAIAIMIEFVAFNIIVVFLGKVSGAYAAAQNLICTLTTVSFMVPLAISNAIAVKAGYANGAGNMLDFKRYSLIGTIMCVGFMMVSAIIVTLFPETLIGLFTKDMELIKICVPVVLLLGIFQVFDGLQVALAGIFKGLKDTKIVLIANFIAYWLISIPLGYTLSFKYNLTLKGFWIGLIFSAVVLCAIMTTYLFKKIVFSNKCQG